MKRNLLLLTSFLLLFLNVIQSQVLMTTDGSYVQNFDALLNTGSVNTWTDNTTIPNVYSQRTSTSVLYAANDGTNTTGGLYSYGTNGTTERAIGTIGSANTSYGGSFAHGILLQNTSGSAISDLKVSYTLEQWRNGGNTTPNTITFWYKVSSTIITALTPGASTGWTAVTALNTNSPINTSTAGALNGNTSANKVTLTNISIPGLNIPDGSYIMLRWLDIDHGGTDHGLAIDDVNLAWTLPCANPTTYFQDNDNDGFGNASVTIQSCSLPVGYAVDSTDCNDNDSLINPNTIWYEDTDGDLYGDANVTQVGCAQPIGYVLNGTDCDVTNSNFNHYVTLYLDADNDGYGNAAISITLCGSVTGYVSDSTDCDDNNNQIHPGAIDIIQNGIDEDCSGADAMPVPSSIGIYEFTGATGCPNQNPNVTTQPVDGVFSLYSSVNTNCSAASNVFNFSGWNTTANIDLTEYNQFTLTANTCRTMNLTMLTFDHKNSGTGTLTWHVRTNLDNYAADLTSGSSSGTLATQQFNLPNLFQNLNSITFRFYVTGAASAATTWRQDNISLTGYFNSLPTVTYYADADGDGFGNGLMDSTTCVAPNGYVTDNTDCNDLDSLINPSTTWYMDMDGDLIGESTMTFTGCVPPSGYVLTSGDCNDMNNQIIGPVTYYVDVDSDSYGDASTAQVLCQNPGSGYVTVGGDCNDNNAQINPAATEICDGIDNDCDGLVDDSLTFVTYFPDADADGFGTGNGQSLCQNPGAGFVTIGGDCNDNNTQINPTATEICDGIDNDCDGLVDDSLTFVTYFPDTDGDGFGTGNGQSLCQNPGAGFVTVGGDCNDNDDQINPSALEICDGIDNDCDGVADDSLTFVTYFTDADGDGFGTGNGQSLCQNPGAGFVTLNGDCNDANAQINPNATETLNNGIDENCDGVDGYLGIEVISDLIVSISPNPNQGTFTIQLSENLNNCEIVLLDLNGKQINKYYFSGDKIQIVETGIEKGVYLMQLSINGNSLVERIIIQ